MKMKDVIAEELSHIYNAAITAVNAQESIGKPIELYEFDFFNCWLIELFDSHT